MSCFVAQNMVCVFVCLCGGDDVVVDDDDVPFSRIITSSKKTDGIFENEK